MFTCYDAGGQVLGRLYQWDTNRTVFVRRQNAPAAPIFHFCCAGDKKALVVKPQEAEGGFTAAVPNVLLQRPEAIYLYLVDGSGEAVATEDLAVLPVEPRAKPEDYEYTEDDDYRSLNVLYARVEGLLRTMEEQLSAAQSHRGNTENPHGVTAAQAGARSDTWMPSAADVGAETAGAAAAALSAHDGDVEAHGDIRDAVEGKADRSTVTAFTLPTASWTGDGAPYSCILTVEGVTAGSHQELLPGEHVTAEELEALQAANITDGGQAAGSITLKAWGDKPTVDIPVRVILRGDA